MDTTDIGRIATYRHSGFDAVIKEVNDEGNVLIEYLSGWCAPQRAWVCAGDLENIRNDRTPAEVDLGIVASLGRFTRIRRLPDGTIAAVGPLITTTALYLGVDDMGWKRRFCYSHVADAHAAFAALTSGDDNPTGWVAKRPEDPPAYVWTPKP